MRDGGIRGTKYERSSYQWFIRFLRGKPKEAISSACKAIGGREAKGKGDINYLIPFLPFVPVLFCYWEADEEFDATGKILIDVSADHFLSIEDAVTVGEIIQKALEDAAQIG